MMISVTLSQSTRRVLAGSVLALAATLAAGSALADPQDAAPRRHRAHLVQTVSAAPPLTVHRRHPRLISGEPIVAEDGFYDGTGLFRRWNDPRLYSFYGWRLGGDNFYGDQAGESITRGNSALGMIAGYGPANGGYGGPHFDSVGGFHNAPNPLARENADYASGSIGQPDYDRPVPRYPSIKQQVAALNTGLAGTGQVIRVRSSGEAWAEAFRN